MSQDNVMTAALDAARRKLEFSYSWANISKIRERTVRKSAMAHRTNILCGCDTEENLTLLPRFLPLVKTNETKGTRVVYRALPFVYSGWRVYSSFIPYIEVLEIPTPHVGKAVLTGTLSEFDDLYGSVYYPFPLPEGIIEAKESITDQTLWQIRRFALRQCYELSGQFGHLQLSCLVVPSSLAPEGDLGSYFEACKVQAVPAPWLAHHKKIMPVHVQSKWICFDMKTFVIGRADIAQGQN